jgi:hypothetical protein
MTTFLNPPESAGYSQFPAPNDNNPEFWKTVLFVLLSLALVAIAFYSARAQSHSVYQIYDPQRPGLPARPLMYSSPQTIRPATQIYAPVRIPALPSIPSTSSGNLLGTSLSNPNLILPQPRIETYSNNIYGVQSIFPTEIIEINLNLNRIEHYRVNNFGVKEIMPFRVTYIRP